MKKVLITTRTIVRTHAGSGGSFGQASTISSCSASSIVVEFETLFEAKQAIKAINGSHGYDNQGMMRNNDEGTTIIATPLFIEGEV